MSGNGSPSSLKPRLLLINSDEAIISVLTEVLQDHDVVAVLCQELEEARALLHNTKFDGALFDWDHEDAYALARAVRTSESNATIPMATVTESHETLDIAQACKFGVQYFLSKPLWRPQLEDWILKVAPRMRQERRTYRRVPIRLAIQCTCTTSGKTLMGNTVNLSASGALVRLPIDPSVSDETNMLIGFPFHDTTERMLLGAEVMRAETHEGECFQVALQFTAVSKKRRETLRETVDRFLEGV